MPPPVLTLTCRKRYKETLEKIYLCPAYKLRKFYFSLRPTTPCPHKGKKKIKGNWSANTGAHYD